VQINIHSLTTTTDTTKGGRASATIMITATDESIKKYPVSLLKAMATIEAEDITGQRYEATAVISTDDTNVKVFLTKN
jgi:hypothetical protein